MSFNVAGAQWCGWSKKQAEELGCKTDANGQTKCLAQEATGKQINFVFCQDKEGKLINQDNPICKNITEKKVEVAGYPAWFEGDKIAENMGGFMDPCQVPGLDKSQLNCDLKEAANQTCKTAQNEARDATVDLVREVEQGNENMKREIDTWKKQHLEPVLNKLEEATAPYRVKCETAQKNAKPSW